MEPVGKSSVFGLLDLERATGFEPATKSLGKYPHPSSADGARYAVTLRCSSRYRDTVPGMDAGNSLPRAVGVYEWTRAS